MSVPPSMTASVLELLPLAKSGPRPLQFHPLIVSDDLKPIAAPPPSRGLGMMHIALSSARASSVSKSSACLQPTGISGRYDMLSHAYRVRGSSALLVPGAQMPGRCRVVLFEQRLKLQE